MRIAALMRTVLAVGGLIAALGPAAAQQKIEPFPDGSTMRKIQDRGKFVVGTRFDTPGINQMNPSTMKLEGVDSDFARFVAGELGLKEDQVEFVEVISANRETAINQGLVDAVISAYAITKKRRDAVGLAGPYGMARHRLFVHEDEMPRFKSPEDIKGTRICATPSSTAAPIVEKFGATLVPFDDYSVCIQQVANKLVDGRIGHDVQMAGFMKNYPVIKIADIPPLGEEGWGIGFRKDDADFCRFLISAIEKAVSSGEWKAIWDRNLGSRGLPAGDPPKPDDHC